jgi:hypothetical protein
LALSSLSRPELLCRAVMVDVVIELGAGEKDDNGQPHQVIKPMIAPPKRVPF